MGEDLTNQCTHYWKIDEYDIGHCIKPGCGAERDFGAQFKKRQRKFIENSDLGEREARKVVEDLNA